MLKPLNKHQTAIYNEYRTVDGVIKIFHRRSKQL